VNLKMKIISVDEAEQSMVVRFYTDKITEQMLASAVDAGGNVTRCRTDMNITLMNVRDRPRGVSIEDFLIRTYAPTAFLAMKEDVADPTVDTSMSDVAQFIGQERTREIDIIEGQFILKDRA
jgi:hypothetical protein